MTKRITGIDVSHWQGRINWQRVAASGERFAFVKAAEGTGWQDRKLRANVSGAEAAGLDVGVYHFARPSYHEKDGTLGEDARDEAQWMVRVVESLKADLALGFVLDLEKSALESPAETVQWADIFCDELQRLTQRRPIVYVGPNFWRWQMARSDRLFDLPLWLVRYKGSPKPQQVPPENRLPTRRIPRWRETFWQWTSKGQVPGVETPCDRNVFMGSELQYQTFLDAQLPMTQPERVCWMPNPANPIMAAVAWMLRRGYDLRGHHG